MPSHFLNVVQNPLSLENPVAKAISRTGRSVDLSRKAAARILVLMRYWWGVSPVARAKMRVK